jgi:hypothetical protein
MSNRFAKQVKNLKFKIKIKPKKEMIEGFFTFQNTTGKTNTADILSKTGFQDTVK